MRFSKEDPLGLYTYEDNYLLRITIRVVVYLCVVISFAWFLVYSFLGQAIISGNSMSPVLEADDMCLVDRLSYDLGKPKRYDVVVFDREDTGKQNVKRIIGLPGESVRISGGTVYINEEELDSEKTGMISLPGIAENTVELAEDEYFVLGDNADSSEDSRFSNIGNVKFSSIRGKLWLVMRPFKRFGLIK